jgi:hypothetical protein
VPVCNKLPGKCGSLILHAARPTQWQAELHLQSVSDAGRHRPNMGKKYKTMTILPPDDVAISVRILPASLGAGAMP